MICVECGQKGITKLYSIYKSDYIKLTPCPRCFKICDKYVEYDSVILFLDLLLLKKGAYRHLAYNITESEIDANPESGFFAKHRYLLKLASLITLLEVYLSWATYEKEFKHSQVILRVLSQPLIIQYLFFILEITVKNIIFNGTIYLISRYVFQLGLKLDSRKENTKDVRRTIKSDDGSQHYVSVLFITTLVAGAIKLFRILTMIWPFDASTMRQVLDLISILYIIEALQIVTQESYTSVIATVIIAKSVASIFVQKFDDFAVSYISL